VFQNSDVLSNPVAGLMIGVLATSLFQSSSTTNGIAISLAVSKGLFIFHFGTRFHILETDNSNIDLSMDKRDVL
jgi:glycerol uptake facilitator-like aquaporin